MSPAGLWAAVLGVLAEDAALRFLLDCYWRASAVLLLACLLSVLMRRCPAAFRHALWLGCLVSLALLPLAMLLLPELRIALAGLPALASRPGGGALVPLVYLAVIGALLAPLLFGLLRLARLSRGALPVTAREQRLLEELLLEQEGGRTPRLRFAPALTGPLSWGLRRPLILLPTAAADWPEQDLRQVLVHELTHVQRLDWLSLLLARAVCLLYWCHPLAWLAARRLEEEAERACDDAVLLTGGDGASYAGLLLAFARRFAASPPRGTALAQPMAQSFLARRLLAILSQDLPRAPSEGLLLIRALLFSLPPLLLFASLELVPEFQTAAHYLGIGKLIEVQLLTLPN